MAQEASTSKVPPASADYDAIAAQLATLRDEVAKLAGLVAASAGNRGRSLANDISEGLGEATRYVELNGRAVDARLQSTVAENPYIALGIAAGVGLLVGALSRR
jgi:ElaB/YqjD/DUF883 family membrane-anchored ribosome-binding protein